MFNMSFGEMIFVGIIALIFIGPKQLPEIARTLGRAFAELKRATGDLGDILGKPRSYMKDQFKEQFKEQFKDQFSDITLDDLKPASPHQNDQKNDPNFTQKDNFSQKGNS